jgi:hypothetical protein
VRQLVGCGGDPSRHSLQVSVMRRGLERACYKKMQDGDAIPSQKIF